MLVGCDYTPGIKGIGTVKALALLREFGHDDEHDAYDRFCEFLKIDAMPRKEIYMSFAEPAFNGDQRQFKWEDEYDFSGLKLYLRKKSLEWMQTL